MNKQTSLSKYFTIFATSITSIFLFYSCQQDSTIEILEEEEYLTKIETYEAKIKDLEEKLGQQKSTRRRPSNIISFGQAQRIYKAYDDRADLISDVVGPVQRRTPFEPTRSLYYEISELRNYLSYIDELSQKVDVKPSGLRFYFALYPDTYVSSSGSSANARRQTIFIAPTVEKKHEDRTVHIGYTLSNQGEVILLDQNNGFSYLRRHRNKADKKNPLEFSGKASDEFSLIANELGATPPEY